MRQQLYSKLQIKLGRSRSSIKSFANNAPNKYKVYTIPKRTSGRRVIAHPSKLLKDYQRALTDILKPALTVHPAAFAYRTGFSIKDNAQMHKNHQYLLKMDFNDFFNSIDPELFEDILIRRGIRFSNAEMSLLTRLLFWNKTKSHDEKLVLSVGAPSSPLISNFVMSIFDAKMKLHCLKRQITYTRYADDLTFSTNKKDVLFNIPQLVKDTLTKDYSHKILINELKTIFASKAHNRHITGVTINNASELSIGRERKRLISALVHKYTVKQLDTDDIHYVQGLLSFAQNIEPHFVDRLSKKYGFDVLSKLIRDKGDE
ncbi:retron St85 family RNA-directed DNA polymerase [Vibrio sp. Isolate33]|uniref:retron St85 family RNA-directed DNA polymerase n=1 Tax=Vibrio sp. Isolate33 TaxID=2908539 RepID=UPI001EFEA71D|nr:retron St85 family RNA-directed DNA polymerase [Vibrio sp. Isolate33]MCG9544799.1 retron St85 family RNA-directed DNA polymerase [Vibrio sp. Isolate33]